MTDDDWNRLFEFCKRQALLGIGFSAVERLHGAGVVCPANIRMQWFGYAMKIERMNGKLNRVCRKLVERLEHEGFACCILKGQSNQMNYPEELKM
ncbi:MAG: nucleotidyltransferase family protein, partial [Prevotella sp.]